MEHRLTMIQGEPVSHLKVLFTVNHEESGWRIRRMQQSQ
jgi:hypothetical protein